jgi:MarR family transcriptional regulator for hemolysin
LPCQRSCLPDSALYALTNAIQPARRAWLRVAASVLVQSGFSVAVATPVLFVSRLGDGVSQARLAQEIGVHPAALARALATAEQGCLIEGAPCPATGARAAYALPRKGGTWPRAWKPRWPSVAARCWAACPLPTLPPPCACCARWKTRCAPGAACCKPEAALPMKSPS